MKAVSLQLNQLQTLSILLSTILFNFLCPFYVGIFKCMCVCKREKERACISRLQKWRGDCEQIYELIIISFIFNKQSSPIILGGNLSLRKLQNFFEGGDQVSSNSYFPVFANHLKKVATTTVKNVSVTWKSNMHCATCWQHNILRTVQMKLFGGFTFQYMFMVLCEKYMH